MMVAEYEAKFMGACQVCSEAGWGWAWSSAYIWDGTKNKN